MRFEGMKCMNHRDTESNENTEVYELDNVTGRAMIHLGKHRHLALDIQKGERYNIILWYRSSKWRKQHQK